MVDKISGISAVWHHDAATNAVKMLPVKLLRDIQMNKQLKDASIHAAACPVQR